MRNVMYFLRTRYTNKLDLARIVKTKTPFEIDLSIHITPRNTIDSSVHNPKTTVTYIGKNTAGANTILQIRDNP